jgi:tetratricopeptide (TPR) repeat protein
LAGQVLSGAARQAEQQAAQAADDAARQASRQQAEKFSEEAETSLRRAVELGPQVPESWLTLISLLAQKGKVEEAETEVRRAQLHLPEDRLPVVLAKVGELLRRPQDAQRHYEAAVLNQPDNPALLRSIASFYLGELYTQPDKMSRANHYLNRMLALPPSSDPAAAGHLAWARRIAARILASSGRYQDFLKAKSVIQADHEVDSMPPENRLEWARLLATRPEPASLQEAKSHLEQLADDVRLNVADRLLLAELYRRSGQWSQAREVLNRAITDHGSDPRVWATYCQMSIEENEFDAAGNHLSRLESLIKQSPAVVELKAKLLARQGQGAEASALIEGSIPDPVTTEQLPQLRRAAALLIELKQYSAAERVYRKMIEIEPRLVLALAEFLGRYGDVNEAFSLFELHFNEQTAPTILGLAANILAERRAEIQDRYDGRVEGWFERAERANPGSKKILLQRAILCEAQGKVKEVEELYRMLLARNDNNKSADDLSAEERAAVLNNLAFHLALRDKDVAQGKQFIDEAIAILGETAELLDTRAMVLMAEGQHTQAIDDLNQSILAGASAQKLFHLALACERSGDRTAALQALQRAEQLGLEASRLSHLERPKYDELVRELGVRQARAA